MATKSKNWIADAIKKPGALKKSLGVKKGEKIPAGKLAAASKKHGNMGQRARLAQTLKGFKLNHYKFLLIGGKESDLLPQSNANCTAKVGNRSQKFYETLVQHNLFFISTNALLTLGLLKLFKGDDYSIDRIFSKIFTNTSYGLISSGLIVKEGNQFIIKPLL